MEVSADIGKDTNNILKKISMISGESIDVVTAEALSVGARVMLSTLKKEDERKPETEIDFEKMMHYIKEGYATNLQNNELLSMVFDKERSQFGAFDVESAVRFSRKVAAKSGSTRLCVECII